MHERIRVLLVDDHSLVRSTLSSWLRSEAGVEVVGSVASADEAITEAIRQKPDVILMDIDMPGLLCFDAARVIKARCPNSKILFLSAFTNDRYIDDALAVEAAGYLTKGEPPETVIHAIREVSSGKVYFSPDVESRITIDSVGARLAREPRTRVQTLTPREIEVLRYVARGMTKKQIAATMHLSVKTVDNHSGSLMTKLDIHDRVGLARFAIREGLAEP